MIYAPVLHVEKSFLEHGWWLKTSCLVDSSLKNHVTGRSSGEGHIRVLLNIFDVLSFN